MQGLLLPSADDKAVERYLDVMVAQTDEQKRDLSALDQVYAPVQLPKGKMSQNKLRNLIFEKFTMSAQTRSYFDQNDEYSNKHYEERADK